MVSTLPSGIESLTKNLVGREQEVNRENFTKNRRESYREEEKGGRDFSHLQR